VALALYLALSKDGRPAFERLIWANLVMEVAQFVTYRLHDRFYASQVWVLSIVAMAFLLPSALSEAADYRPLNHRTILFWWLALGFGAAWIRYFPYTGTVWIFINALAFLCWILEKCRRIG
jgi:hypothetical protein